MRLNPSISLWSNAVTRAVYYETKGITETLVTTLYICLTCAYSFFPTELMSFKQKRIAAFRKNLIEMAELEIKHAKVCSLEFDICSLKKVANV